MVDEFVIDFGLSREEFRKEYFCKKPLLVRRAFRGECSWDTANRMFQASDPSGDDLHMSLEGLISKERYTEKYFEVGVERSRLVRPAVYYYLRKGATLVANRIKNDEFIDLLTRQAGTFFGCPIVGSAYAAFGASDSFRAHWDTRDILAIQLIGKKKWRVYEPTFPWPIYSQQSKNLEDQFPCPIQPSMEFVLEAGDVLYLPRGWWHNPIALGEPTFHLSLGIFPPNALTYVEWIVKRLQDHVESRKSLLDWHDSAATIDIVAAEIAKNLQDKQNFEQFRNELLIKERVDSKLAIEKLGTSISSVLSDLERVRLNANSCLSVKDGFVVANGLKLMLDEQAACLVAAVDSQPGIAVFDLCAKFPPQFSEKIKILVTQLCRQDILALN